MKIENYKKNKNQTKDTHERADDTVMRHGLQNNYISS